MNFEEYSLSGREIYRSLADVVRSLLLDAFENDETYRLQEIQCRAKTLKSLKRRLVESGSLDADNIEMLRKDLAGCRIVFYTNGDVSRFINSGILGELFDVDWDEYKIHQPSPDEEEAASLFRSHNFVVALGEDRTGLVEYKKFEGMRCEIQVQTILDHAWSEMAHDTIYKRPELKGFGTKSMEDIERRLATVMKDYLIPAGHIFQRVSNDIDRLLSGKELLDFDVLDRIASAENNNERYDAIVTLKDDILPFVDDISSIYPDIQSRLAEAWLAADQTRIVPRQTDYGDSSGTKSHRVTRQVAEIFERYRYLNIEKTYEVTRDLSLLTTDQESQAQLIKLAESLAAQTLQIWEQYGPEAQVRLANALEKEARKLEAYRVVCTVADKILDTEVTGTTSSSDAVTFHSGSVLYSEALVKARRIAIETLFEVYEQSNQHDQKRFALSNIFSATQLPMRSGYSNDVTLMVVRDALYIVRRLSKTLPDTELDFQQDYEERIFNLWRRFKTIPDHQKPNEELVKSASDLTKSILALKDKLNENEEFVTFKVLVGFRSVFEPRWTSGDLDFERDREFRAAERQRIANQISKSDYDKWKDRLSSAFSVVSNDLATFPPLAEFLNLIAPEHPHLIHELLLERNSLPDWSVRPLAAPLLKSDIRSDTIELLSEWVKEHKYLREISYALLDLNPVDSDFVKSVAHAAIATRNGTACAALSEVSARRYSEDNELWRDGVFMPILREMSKIENTEWVDRTWFLSKKDSIYSALSDEQAEVVMSAMIPVREIDYHVENIIKTMSSHSPNRIISWFEQRLSYSETASAFEYSAFPFQFQQIHTILQPHASDLISAIRDWYENPDLPGKWLTAHLLSKIYPEFEEPLASALNLLARDADADTLEFIVSSIEGFEGNSALLPLLKNIVSSAHLNERIESGVSHILHETGMMSGEFGPAETYQAKADSLRPWLDDQNKNVVEFARREIRRFERQSKSDYRRGQEGIAMRRLDYGEPIAPTDKKPDPDQS